jgi:hypothetical protein
MVRSTSVALVTIDLLVHTTYETSTKARISLNIPKTVWICAFHILVKTNKISVE